MYFSSGFQELDSLLGGGYNEKTTVLIIGPTGVSKETLLYNFAKSGIDERDTCLYVTRQLVNDVLRDAKARGIDLGSSGNERLTWIAAGGSEKKFAPDSLAKLSFAVKDYLKENREKKKTRIVLDSISSLLLTNSPDSVYSFLPQLFAEIKLYDACFLAVLEQDMHPASVIASMEQIFDGVLKVDYGEGEASVIEVRKMTGVDIPGRSRVVIPRRMRVGKEVEIGSQNIQQQQERRFSLQKVGENSDTGVVPLKRRLAILPLSNMSKDPDDDYLADGMTEELITVISKIKDLRVIARTSIMSYKGTTKRISDIGRELTVGSILDGSVRKFGDRMRVSVQMVDTSSEEHLWAESYDRGFADIFSVQTDIAKQVSRTLKAKLRSRETELIAKKQTDNMNAYAFYVKGRVALHGRTRKAMEEATKYFGQAITKDARYARAYAGLADSMLLMTSYGYIDSKRAYLEAREFISKAIEFDENLSEAHVSLGFLHELQYDFQGAREEFEHAISLNPSDSQARHWYAINLAIFNRLDEAIRELERALEADPLSPQIRTVLGGFYAYVGRDEEALAQWEKVLRTNPNNVPVHLNRGIYFALRAKKEEALSDMNKAMELSSNATVVKCLLGYVVSILGDRERALGILEEIKNMSHQTGEYVSPFYFAILYAGLGDREEAFSFLDKAIEDKSAEIESLLHDLMFQDLKSDPRFLKLIEKIGLAVSSLH